MHINYGHVMVYLSFLCLGFWKLVQHGRINKYPTSPTPSICGMWNHGAMQSIHIPSPNTHSIFIRHVAIFCSICWSGGRNHHLSSFHCTCSMLERIDLELQVEEDDVKCEIMGLGRAQTYSIFQHTLHLHLTCGDFLLHLLERGEESSLSWRWSPVVFFPLHWYRLVRTMMEKS